MSTFNEAIGTVLKHEGGYVNHPKDPGGETKYGISKRSYSNVDIKNLTEEQAKEIYYRDFWDKYKYGGINDQALATKIFDMCVNMGAKQAHTLLQRSCNEVAGNENLIVDGRIGAKTLAAINSLNAKKLLQVLREFQADYYRALVANNPVQYGAFLKGWLIRAAS